MTEATDLYRHYDAQGVLLYVGVSLNAVGRLADHKRAAPWFCKISRVTVEHYASREAALEAERLAIVAEKPLHNVQFNAAVNPPPPRNSMEARFEFLLPVADRRELAALASKSGLSAADLVRLSLYQVLENPALEVCLASPRSRSMSWTEIIEEKNLQTCFCGALYRAEVSPCWNMKAEDNPCLKILNKSRSPCRLSSGDSSNARPHGRIAA